MIKLQVPKFDEHLMFVGYKVVKVKDKIDRSQEEKVWKELPGIPCGYCSALCKIGETLQPIEITRFYDSRQKGVGRLKNFYITVLQN